MNLRTIYLRARYWWRKLVVFLGSCPDCGRTLDYMPNGRAFCFRCGRAP